MNRTMSLFLLIALVYAGTARAEDNFEKARQAILGLAGCYHVDYNFTEIQPLGDATKIDDRVYDVNVTETVKELIVPIEISSTHIRLQHILFSTDASGAIPEGSMIRHQAEDWEYQPAYYYDFTSPLHWRVVKADSAGKWVRRITNLDDGLRYQCLATWDFSGEYPEWKCENYAPIPGRETRPPMSRRDYQTLQRRTRIIAYGEHAWLERQENDKYVDKDGVKKPIAKENGKLWYIEAPSQEECSEATAWSAPRLPYWELSRVVWNGVLDGKKDFVEKAVAGGPRFMKMWEIENKYFERMADPAVQQQITAEMLAVIAAYRE